MVGHIGLVVALHQMSKCCIKCEIGERRGKENTSTTFTSVCCIITPMDPKKEWTDSATCRSQPLEVVHGSQVLQPCTGTKNQKVCAVLQMQNKIEAQYDLFAS
jgi:hypothetical protein